MSSVLAYHEATKHSEVRIGASGHYLDWDNKPAPFKEYRNLPSIALPRDFPIPQKNSIEAIKNAREVLGTKEIDVGVLSELLFFSAGLTRKMRFGKEFYFMRAASATGALYPIELYVISGPIPGLEAGVYHFNPLQFSLVRLRDGDYRAALSEAGSPDGVTSSVTLAFTSLAWRNAWKYEARSYRHWFWDSGVIIANLLATSNSARLAARVVLGFIDSEVDRLLGLEAKKEATVALATIGIGTNRETSSTHRPVPSLDLEVNPLSREEVDYPMIWETNEASQLRRKSEIESWRSRPRVSKQTSPTTTPSFPLRGSERDLFPLLDEVILLRGSTRKFSREPILFDSLSTIIQTSRTRIPLDFLHDNESLIDFYFIVNAVEGLPPGSYYYNQRTRAVEELKALSSRSMSGYLCLGQQLFSDASVVFFLMTDLNSVLESLGNRGYRAAQFEAGVRAGKIYLSSYAVGLGASGSTFYDDAVTEFFSPHARDKSTMIAVGIGKPAYKAKPGKILPQIGPNR
ncbi:MAG TPA: SagB/ThcOx family dehydrogenase [Candidatus Bathyarchaeia archaeon]|nr:SagB/ThcOx family dehydrogenase [Candidatus Bathyarchaeia archaeon]